jgi:uncharacterized protein GlcG (DUF336 family)
MKKLVIMLVVFPAGGSSAASDQVRTKTWPIEPARNIASLAVKTCRSEGFRVSVVIVDGSGVLRVVHRDARASRFNTELAVKKANPAILSRVSATEFFRSRPDFRCKANLMDDVPVDQGRAPIRAAGSLLDAIGVSGARGGALDEKCANSALGAVRERLEFAD